MNARTVMPVCARALADLTCPQQCVVCATVVEAEQLLCHVCQRSMRVLAAPECERCGRPGTGVGDGLCAGCEVAPPGPIRRARAYAAYRGSSGAQPVARVVAALKYQGQTRLARRMAHLMAPRVPDRSVALIAPVPLHPTRLRSRGFNQSALLARHLARSIGRRATLDLLTRWRATPSQTALTGGARRANVAGAFAVTRGTRVRGRSVLIVDDVWTSGATAQSIAAALRGAGAVAVDVITFARVV